MDLQTRLLLRGDLRSPTEARRFVARTLTPLLGREDVETAMLVTSELVTNAALHAGTECELELRGEGSTLVIRVSDFDKQVGLRRQSFGAETTAGRGLRLLEVLCRRWGVDSDERGKTVWCELRVRGGRPPGREDGR
jgi:sigma-B regulation protein RsbU (phosphoserine phosphatase)